MDLANQPLSRQSTATQRNQSLKLFYLICTVLSVLISWGIFAQFLLTGNASAIAFFQQAFQTPIATLVSSDVLISALIFLTFARIELNRLGMPGNRFWLYIVGTFSVGVCFALGLFLYQREIWLGRAQAP